LTGNREINKDKKSRENCSRKGQREHKMGSYPTKRRSIQNPVQEF
jgi:hypothetical protein